MCTYTFLNSTKLVIVKTGVWSDVVYIGCTATFLNYTKMCNIHISVHVECCSCPFHISKIEGGAIPHREQETKKLVLEQVPAEVSGGSSGGSMGSMEPPFCRQLEDQPAHGTVFQSREICDLILKRSVSVSYSSF